MRRYLIHIAAIGVLAGSMWAQQKASSLPTEETVNSFLQQTFGYDSSVTWKIASIKPSAADGMAEVDVVLAGPNCRTSDAARSAWWRKLSTSGR